MPRRFCESLFAQSWIVKESSGIATHPTGAKFSGPCHLSYPARIVPIESAVVVFNSALYPFFVMPSESAQMRSSLSRSCLRHLIQMMGKTDSAQTSSVVQS